MSPNITEAMLVSQLRAQRIIIASLIFGASVFLGFVVVAAEGRAPIQGLPVVSLVAVIFTGSALIAREVFSRLQVRGQRRRVAAGTWQMPVTKHGQMTSSAPASDGDKLLLVYQMQLIMRAALLEGPAFFCGIAYMIEGQTWVLAMAVLLIVGQALSFPTRDRVERWVREQLELIELERGRSN